MEKSALYRAFKKGGMHRIGGMPGSPHQQFGRNVCRLRTVRELTQEQLAEKADISRRYLQEIEAGQMNPTVNILSRLHKALKCSWDDLLLKV